MRQSKRYCAAVQEVLYPLDADYALILGSARVVYRQNVPVRVVFLVAVEIDRPAVAPAHLPLEVPNPRQRIDGGDADYLILEAAGEIIERCQTRIVHPLAVVKKPSHAVVAKDGLAEVEAIERAVEGHQKRTASGPVQQRPQVVRNCGRQSLDRQMAA